MTREEKIRGELYLILELGGDQKGDRLHLVMVFLQRGEGREAGERAQASPPRGPPQDPRLPRPTYAFMLLPLPLSTMYGVFWAFCFSWSKATVPRGVSLELIFFRSCRGMASQHRAGAGPDTSRGGGHPHVPTGHPPPPRPASSFASPSSSCLSPSRGSGGTAAGTPVDTGQGGVRAANANRGQGGVVTHLTQCWAQGGRMGMGEGHLLGFPGVGRDRLRRWMCCAGGTRDLEGDLLGQGQARRCMVDGGGQQTQGVCEQSTGGVGVEDKRQG